MEVILFSAQATIRYRGYYYDKETGYYYCQSRYYNPVWCRWISSDALFDTGTGILGTNMYAYCRNDPMNLLDPTGYFDSRVHTTKTHEWAYDYFIAAGFSHKDALNYALILAKANQSVDDKPTSPHLNFYNPNAQAWHFNINTFTKAGSAKDSRVILYNACLDAGNALMSNTAIDKNVRIEGALELYGRGLHAAQDIITHRGLNDLAIIGGIHGHAKLPKTDFMNPDAPTPENLALAQFVTEITIEMFIRVGRKSGLF